MMLKSHKAAVRAFRRAVETGDTIGATTEAYEPLVSACEAIVRARQHLVPKPAWLALLETALRETR